MVVKDSTEYAGSFLLKEKWIERYDDALNENLKTK